MGLSNYECLGCGERIRTETKTVRRRGEHAYGDYDDEVTAYHSGADGFFVKLDNYDPILGIIEADGRDAARAALDAFEKELQAGVRKQEWREMIREKEIPRIKRESMDNYTTIGELFDTLNAGSSSSSFGRGSSYAAHRTCVASLLELEDAKPTKVLTDEDEETVYKWEIPVTAQQFAEIFNYFVSETNFILPESEHKMTLHLRHFSDR